MNFGARNKARLCKRTNCMRHYKIARHYCIAERFVTVREQHLVALGATNCTYPPANLA